MLVEHGHDISGPTTARPTNAEVGQRFFDTTLNAYVAWNGSEWQEVGLVQANFVYGEATPLDAAFFVAARPYRVRAIVARTLVVGSDGGAVTAQVRKAPSGTAAAAGTVLHTGTIDLKGTINTNQALTLSATVADLNLATGDALCIDVTGTTTAARGVISVLLSPR